MSLSKHKADSGSQIRMLSVSESLDQPMAIAYTY